MPRPLTQMTADDVRALILGELRWPPDLPIVEVEVEERVDSVGDDALYVTLIPPNELPEEVLASDEARELRSAVSRLLLSHDEPRFPYTRMLRRRDLDEVYDEDED